MAKINATYGAGYYIDPNSNYLQIAAKQEKERRRNPSGAGNASAVMRQTFAAPFTIICLKCEGRTARGTHQYVNRRKTSEKYLGMPIWELEFRCQHCNNNLTLNTDLETAKITGGYKCVKGCRRPEGDYMERNIENAKATAALKAAKTTEELGAAGDMEALALHNERMERIHATNREIEQRLSSAQAGQRIDDEDDDDFLDGSAVGTNSSAVSSLSRRLLRGIREKRAREEEGAQDYNSEASQHIDDPFDFRSEDDDKEFEAFQSQLRAAVDRDERISTAASGDPLSPSLDDVAQAANPFLFLDNSNEGSGDSDPTGSNGSNSIATGAVTLVVKKKTKSSSLLDKFA